MPAPQVAGSPAGKTIVSYDNIVQPFPDTQTLLGMARQAAGQVIPDPKRADARVAQLSGALDDLKTSQGNNSRVMNTPRNAMAGLLQTHLAMRAQQENKLESFILRSVDFVLEAFEVKFSSADWIGYMLSFFTWIEDLAPAACPPAPPVAAPIPDSLRMAVIGDWGTGLYGAPVCIDSIRSEPDGYDLLLHLGDVYYSGLDTEVEERFEKFWPQPTASTMGRSLNGNHEMYTGGHAYFEKLLPYVNQTSSYFAFQNNFWTLIMLDTAYNQPFGGQEGDLFQAQIDWLDGIIQAAGDRKIVLFSHHQPFSLLDPNQGPKLVAALGKYLSSRKIFAWYWGHEHRCVLYDPHPAWGFHGRCVGHGGFPQNRSDLSNAPFNDQFGDQWRLVSGKDAPPGGTAIPGGMVLDTANLYIPTFETQFSPHGFMRLEFNKGALTEFVRAPDNANIYLEPLA
ncbi:MAG TPA: metallophosphoesterase [Bryobacteraceae bacterium]|nr:metallophosphoesterase [Bryobacteraceae bacterium]